MILTLFIRTFLIALFHDRVVNIGLFDFGQLSIDYLSTIRCRESFVCIIYHTPTIYHPSMLVPIANYYIRHATTTSSSCMSYRVILSLFHPSFFIALVVSWWWCHGLYCHFHHASSIAPYFLSHILNYTIFPLTIHLATFDHPLSCILIRNHVFTSLIIDIYHILLHRPYHPSYFTLSTIDISHIL